MNTTTTFEDLSNEAIILVFSFLPAAALGRCECVCVEWRDLIQSDRALRRKKRNGKTVKSSFNVKKWLARHNLGDFATDFIENGITTPDVIIALTQEDLKEELKITNLGARKRILLAAEELAMEEGEKLEDKKSKKSDKTEEKLQRPPIKHSLPNDLEIHRCATCCCPGLLADLNTNAQCFAGGLFGCFSDLKSLRTCPTCFYSFLCPCIQFGLNVEELHNLVERDVLPCGESDTCASSGTCCCLINLGCIIPFLGTILSTMYRALFCQAPVRYQIRESLGMQPNGDFFCGDVFITAACPCCALSQEARALALIRHVNS